MRILRGTVGDGGRPLAVGEVLYLADGEANALIARGRAEAVLGAEVLDDAAPVAVVRDPVPSRARGRR